MKMTKENKLRIVEITYDIKQQCKQIEKTILSHGGAYCFDSGSFQEINNILALAKELKDIESWN